MNISKLRKSRNLWKAKAVDRKRSVELLSKRLARKDVKMLFLMQEVESHAAKIRLQRERISSLEKSMDRQETRVLCVTLFVLGVVPCNAVVRVLRHFKNMGFPGLNWIPDPSSVVNWIGRCGLGMLKLVGVISNPWIAMIDMSISFGKNKVLVVLRVPLQKMNLGKAIQLSDVECIGVEISDNWTGNNVQQALQNIFERSGVPKALLQDGGSDLAKAARLLKKTNKGLIVLSDIGHVFANILKKKYATSEPFLRLLILANRFRSRVLQTELSGFRPPKMRAKGRFQSISKLVTWAQQLQRICGGKGRAKTGSLKQKLRDLLPELWKLSGFLNTFSAECLCLNQVQKALKSRGLNQKTFLEVKELLLRLDANSEVRTSSMAWLTKHIWFHCNLKIGQQPLPVSTDVLESLMGKLKVIIGRHSGAEFSTMTLAIPLMCGNLNAEKISASFRSISHADLTLWRGSNIQLHSHKNSELLFQTTGRVEPKIVQEHILRAQCRSSSSPPSQRAA